MKRCRYCLEPMKPYQGGGFFGNDGNFVHVDDDRFNLMSLDPSETLGYEDPNLIPLDTIYDCPASNLLEREFVYDENV